MLANELKGFAIWFAWLENGVSALTNGFAKVTNQPVTLAIGITGLAIRFAGLANSLELLANRLKDPAIWFTALGNGVAELVNGFCRNHKRACSARNPVCWARKLA